MKKALILYASKGGSTAEVAHFITSILNDQDVQVDLVRAHDFNGNVSDYDALILGSPIYKGVWMTELWHVVRRIEADIRDTPIWGFSLCMRALEPGGQDYANYHYLPHNILDRLNLQEYRFFAGRLHNLSISDKTTFYETYDGQVGRQEGDYRDWQVIRAWALQIAKRISLGVAI